MTTYYANNDLAAYRDQVANYQSQRQAWDDSKAVADAAHDQAMAEYQTAHDTWEQNGGIDPTTEQPYPEPQPPADPTYPPEPQPPTTPTTIFDEHEVTAPEEIQTATGPALVLAGRVVLSSDGGATAFALTPQELAAGYTPTDEADL